MSKPTDRDEHTHNLAHWIAYVVEGMSEEFRVTGTSEPADNYERLYLDGQDGVHLRVTIETDPGPLTYPPDTDIDELCLRHSMPSPKQILSMSGQYARDTVIELRREAFAEQERTNYDPENFTRRRCQAMHDYADRIEKWLGWRR